MQAIEYHGQKTHEYSFQHHHCFLSQAVEAKLEN